MNPSLREFTARPLNADCRILTGAQGSPNEPPGGSNQRKPACAKPVIRARARNMPTRRLGSSASTS